MPKLPKQFDESFQSESSEESIHDKNESESSEEPDDKEDDDYEDNGKSDFSSDDDDDEINSTPKTKSKGSRRGNSFKGDQESEELEFDGESDSDSDYGKSKRKRKPKKAQVKRGRKKPKPKSYRDDKGSSDDTDEDLKSQKVWKQTSTKTKGPKTRLRSSGLTTNQRPFYSELDDDEDEEDQWNDTTSASPTTRRSKRSTVRHTNEQIYKDESSSSNDESKIKTLKNVKRPETDDDDDYAFDGKDNNEEDSSESDNIDYDDVESNGEDKKPRARPIRGKEKNHKKMNSEEHVEDHYHSSESSQDEIYPRRGSRRTQVKHSPHVSHSPKLSPTTPSCLSTHDEITTEKLEPLHVCYLAPDKKTRHCFNLNTIYRATLMSGRPVYDPNTGLRTLLQPPHFRTVMDAHLLDQIASRFGRKALVIEESAVYRKEHGFLSRRNEFSMDDYGVIGDDRDDRHIFQDRFENYMSKEMGSGDLYCCPLCYTEAHRRFHGGTSADSDSDDEEKNTHERVNVESHSLEKVTASKVDPMTILGSVDEDEFLVASKFCFRKITQMKNHLRSDHCVDTSILFSNDLFKRFQIRAQDGLVQRHLHAYWQGRKGRGTGALVGAMRQYWDEGHNQSFILLRYFIENQYDVTLHQNNEADVETENFCLSFPKRSKDIWRCLSAPYQKGDLDDNEDFIDDNEEYSDEGPGHNFNDAPASDCEDKMVQELRRRRTLDASSVSDSESTKGINSDTSLSLDNEIEKIKSPRGAIRSRCIYESDDD